MNIEEFKKSLPEASHKHIDPSLDKNQKLMTASGALPLPPNQTILIAGFYLLDSDPEVVTTAKATLLDFPVNVLVPIVKTLKIGSILDFFAREKMTEPLLVEPIILNTATEDATLIYLASLVSEALTVIMVNNQVRLIKEPQIAIALKTNPHMLRSNIDMMCSFLRINGIVLEGESSELSDAEIREILAMQDSATDIPLELVQEIPEEQITDERRKSIYQLIQTMGIAQKIKIALTGNKEARSILVKDTNKIVCSAVIKSPKVTDMEIMNIANMRTVNDEVIRLICIKPDWVRHYSIQVALANNPKTPFPVALKFVRQLRVSDLAKVAKNKNITSQLSKIAAELFETKRK